MNCHSYLFGLRFLDLLFSSSEQPLSSFSAVPSVLPFYYAPQEWDRLIELLKEGLLSSDWLLEAEAALVGSEG